jgi:hypothetical protein
MPPIRWGAADTCTHLSHNGTTAREMDFPTRTAKERAAHYEQEAEKFRRMAEAEPVENIRQELLGVAEQYRMLAESLNDRRSGQAPPL